MVLKFNTIFALILTNKEMITTAKQNLKAPNGLKITIGMEVNILFRGESVIVCKDSQSFITNLDTAQYCFNI